MPRGARPGERRGGRRKGSRNRTTIAHEASARITADQAAAEGLTPLEMMLANMRHFHPEAVAAEASVLALGEQLAAIGAESDPQEAFPLLLAEVKKAAGLRLHAQACARDAAPYVHARIAPVESTQRRDDFVPLAERLKEYARRDAIEESEGKVIELKPWEPTPREPTL